MKEILRTRLPNGWVVVTVHAEGEQLSPHPSDPMASYETRLLGERDEILCGPAWAVSSEGAQWVHETMVDVAGAVCGEPAGDRARGDRWDVR